MGASKTEWKASVMVNPREWKRVNECACNKGSQRMEGSGERCEKRREERAGIGSRTKE